MGKIKGVTLVELLVSILILSFTILVFVESFSNISKAVISSKAKTLATNLAQEKIQILRQLPYHRILVTPEVSYYTEVSPPIPYDTVYFPPERILEGGMYFTRYTYVYSVQEVDGKIEPLPAGVPDQGMKCIEVSVVYDTVFGKKTVRLKTVETNPNIEAYRGSIVGKVRNANTLQPLRGALVVVAENIGCRDYTNSNGEYAIRVPFGSYNVMASLRGYFSTVASVSVGASEQTLNFNLQPMSTGTAIGFVWLNDRVVISQIVGSSKTVSGFSQEYIELYNPTSEPVQMAISISSGIIGLKYQSTTDLKPKNIILEYRTLTIPPSSYYLIASTTEITVCGITKRADAVFSEDNPDYPNIIKTKDEDNPQSAGGGIGIYYISSGEWIDVVGWDAFNVLKQAPLYEENGIDQNIGLEENEQYVRRTSPLGFDVTWGNSYDSDNNNVDFLEYKPIIVPPRNSTDTLPPMTGRPAVGSIVSCNDGLSETITAQKVGSPPYARFVLVNVATGTWTVIVASNNVVSYINNVIIVENTVVPVPNNSTIPSWYPINMPYVYLSSVTHSGFISGRVKDVIGIPLANIQVKAGSEVTYTNTEGYYFLPMSTGIYSVVANPNNLNPLYIESVKNNVVVNLGQITSGIDFVLSQGGRITGFVTMDKINPLSGIVFVAKTEQGFVYGEDVSDVSGRFYISNLSSGTYYVQPVLSNKETSVPAVSTVTVRAGLVVHAGTFTITGCVGKIKGKVTLAGKPISTGVLIIATPTTITFPPDLSINSLTSVPYFITNSYEDGTYTLEVIGSSVTTYNVYGFYTTYGADNVPIINKKEILNLTVLPGSEVLNKNFEW